MNENLSNEKSKRLLELMAAASIALVGSNAMAKDNTMPHADSGISTITVIDESDIDSNQANGCCGNSSCSCNASC